MGLLFPVALPTTGCSALAAMMPAIMETMSVVQDAAQILALVSDGAAAFFRHKGPAATEESRRAVDEAITKARLALVAANRANEEETDVAKVEAALEGFRKAYKDLVAKLVAVGAMAPDGTFSAAPNASAAPLIRVPAPKALTYHVGR